MSRVTIDANDVNINPVDSNVLLGDILNVVYFWAGVVAVLAIIWGGMMYITANGDSSKVSIAKATIISAVSGLVFVILAFVITGFVMEAVGGVK